jgi:hypothetical protein
MLGHKERGSMALVGMAAVLALSLSALYVKNTSDQQKNQIQKVRMDGHNADALNNNLANLALMRGMLNPAKKGSVWEPALYPTDYFASNWTLAKNTRTEINLVLNAQNVTVHSFRSDIAPEKAKRYLGAEGRSLALDMLSPSSEIRRDKDLKIIRPNVKGGAFPFWVESLDIQANNKILKDEVRGLSDDKNVVSIGRVSLLPPEPGAIEVELRPASGGAWIRPDPITNTFGSAAVPLAPTNYQLRLTANGVTWFGKITREDGAEMIVGFENGEIRHNARNIKARSEILGETVAFRLGIEANETSEEVVNEIRNVTVPGATTSGGDATSQVAWEDGASCNFKRTGAGSPTASPTTPAPAGSGVGGTTTNTTATPTTTVVTTTAPAEIKYRVAAIGVNGLEGSDPKSAFDLKIFVTKTTKVTRTTIARVTTVTTTTPGSGGGGGSFSGGDPSSNCRNMCNNLNNVQALAGETMWTTLTLAEAGGGNSQNLHYFAPDESGGIQSLGLPGVVCANYEGVAANISQEFGGQTIQQIKNNSFLDWSGKWVQVWASPNASAKQYEKFYAFIAPSCARQLIGGRKGSCGCFEESTLIRMADGSERTASEIRQGDLLWNPKTQKNQYVKRVIAGPEKIPLYAVKIKDTTVRVTQGHPFLTPLGLVQAKDLRAGDRIIDNGQENFVESVGPEVREAGTPDPTVWNFELEGEHDDDHYVLANGIMTGDLYLQIKLQESLKSQESEK